MGLIKSAIYAGSAFAMLKSYEKHQERKAQFDAQARSQHYQYQNTYPLPAPANQTQQGQRREGQQTPAQLEQQQYMEQQRYRALPESQQQRQAAQVERGYYSLPAPEYSAMDRQGVVNPVVEEKRK